MGGHRLSSLYRIVSLDTVFRSVNALLEHSLIKHFSRADKRGVPTGRENSDPKIVDPTSARFFTFPFAIAAYFLILGILPLVNGQLVPRYFFGALLYFAFGLAIRLGHPIAKGRFWWLAAIAGGGLATPEALVFLAGTVLLTRKLRTDGRSPIQGSTSLGTTLTN